MKEFLFKLTNHETLTRKEMREIMLNISEGKYSDVQIATFLTTIAMRGVDVDEILGLRDGLLESGLRVDFSDYKVIDIVGTGGDGKNTFNISTCSCFIVAAAGYKVAKHGNYASTSISGAGNVIESYGVKFTNDQDKLRRSLDECGFVYMHAPLFANGMKCVGPTRRAMQIPTCFNMLGPLINPCSPENQMLGVANLTQMRIYNAINQKLGVNFCIVTSADGYDEISLTSSFKIKTPTQERIYTPEDLGLRTIKAKEIYGGNTIQEAHDIFDNVLQNRSTESQKNVIIANAAFALHTMDEEKDILECADIAREMIESGKAYETLKKYVELNG